MTLVRTRIISDAEDLEMSNCGCKGHYHNGGCSDQNVIWWMDENGKLPAAGIPVNPTDAELAAQEAIIKKRLDLPEAASVFGPQIGWCRHLIDLDKYCYQCYLDSAISENREDYV